MIRDLLRILKDRPSELDGIRHRLNQFLRRLDLAHCPSLFEVNEQSNSANPRVLA
jgi:hypothetical protein